MTGAERIAFERLRQIDIKGWTPEHDAEYTANELLLAADCYLHYGRKRTAGAKHLGRIPAFSEWPWERRWWKPDLDPIRNLEKAGALIAAEIDRLQRAATQPTDSRSGETNSEETT